MEGYREGEMKLTFMLCLDEAIDNFMGTLKWWDLQIHNEKSVKLLISFFGCVYIYKVKITMMFIIFLLKNCVMDHWYRFTCI